MWTQTCLLLVRPFNLLLLLRFRYQWTWNYDSRFQVPGIVVTSSRVLSSYRLYMLIGGDQHIFFTFSIKRNNLTRLWAEVLVYYVPLSTAAYIERRDINNVTYLISIANSSIIVYNCCQFVRYIKLRNNLLQYRRRSPLQVRFASTNYR